MRFFEIVFGFFEIAIVFIPSSSTLECRQWSIKRYHFEICNRIFILTLKIELNRYSLHLLVYLVKYLLIKILFTCLAILFTQITLLLLCPTTVTFYFLHSLSRFPSRT